MKKLNKNIVLKTKVEIYGLVGSHEIIEINETRVNFKIKNFEGSFQAGHIKKYTNKGVSK